MTLGYKRLHCLSLLFTKSTMDLSGVMAKLPLSQRVATTAGSEVVFLVREKMIISDLGRAADT
ncbi:hypothetical protein POPTR_008G063301v4 [Populus trichocarpa]|uniref:Uncharacterized protein n=1 Tax=Populus trichocarpa TaxID=3694 RepID=A0ACC0SK39_POPTR|nr:hypothetical protein POPTR_008G063301v4 [Populus trichocarpa]